MGLCSKRGKEAPLTIKDGKVLVDLEMRISAGISGTGSFVQTGGGSGEERTEGTAAVLEGAACTRCSVCDSCGSKNLLCGISEKAEKEAPGSTEKKTCKKNQRIRGEVRQGGNRMREQQFSAMVNQFQPGIFTALNDKKEEMIQAGKAGVQSVSGNTGFLHRHRM